MWTTHARSGAGALIAIAHAKSRASAARGELAIERNGC